MSVDSFRFLHAADIHLDSPLRGLARYEGVPAEAVRTATREALENLVELALRESVAFLVIAGDLYDGDWEDFGTGLFFCGAMRRLADAGIDVFLLYGNHDADSSITRKLPLPPNVHVFPHRAPGTFEHAATGTLLHGQSYRDRDPGGNLALAYPAAASGRFNVGVLHTCLQGDPEHAPYSPCEPAELAAKGYDYWALGHVHQFAIVRERPHIVFPGNLQGRSVRETGPKGAALVTVDAGSVAAVEHVPLDVVRWARVEVDASGFSTAADVETAIRTALLRARDQGAAGRPLVVRVEISGATEAHDALLGRRQDLREDVRAVAAGVSERIWIEKVRLRTTRVTTATLGAAGDDLSALLATAAGDPELREVLRLDFADLAGRLPADLGGDSEPIAAVRAGEFDGIVARAAESLRLRLAGGRA
jgi:exonuclease SbcD